MKIFFIYFLFFYLIITSYRAYGSTYSCDEYSYTPQVSACSSSYPLYIDGIKIVTYWTQLPASGSIFNSSNGTTRIYEVLVGAAAGCAQSTSYRTYTHIMPASYDTDSNSIPDICESDPSHCDDGLFSANEGESGIDCGGTCSEPCIEGCPPGSSLKMREATDGGGLLPYCIGESSVPSAPGGACPPASGDVIKYLPNSDGTCSPWVGFPTLTAAGDGDGLVPAVDIPDPETAWSPSAGPTEETTVAPPVTVQNADGSTTVTVGQETVISTPDGGKIATNNTSETTTNSDGTKTQVDTKDVVRTGSDATMSRSTTTTVSNYDSNGNLTGQTSSTTKGGDGSGIYDSSEEDASNYSPVGAAGTPDGIGDQLGSLLASFKADVSAAPVFSLKHKMFSGIPPSTTPVTVLDFGSYGQFDFDFSEYETSLNLLGMIFMVLSFFASLKLVLVNKG